MFIHNYTDKNSCSTQIDWFFVEGRSLYEVATYIQRGIKFASIEMLGSTLHLGIYNPSKVTFCGSKMYHLFLQNIKGNASIGFSTEKNNFVANIYKPILDHISSKTWLKLIKKEKPSFECPGNEEYPGNMEIEPDETEQGILDDYSDVDNETEQTQEYDIDNGTIVDVHEI